MKILKLVEEATGNSGIKRFNPSPEQAKKTKTSKIDSNIITKEKLLAEAERTQINFIEKAKRKLKEMLKGASSKPNLGIEMEEEEQGSLFDGSAVFSKTKEVTKDDKNDK